MSMHQPITRSNFETYLVDYWDGQLTPAQTELLMRFLEENPDLKQLADGAEVFSVSSIPVSFDDKDLLRKTEVNETTVDEFLVAELEQQLMPHQENELHRFLAAFPAYENDRKLYALTRLKADKALVYPNKKELKKGAVVPMWVRYSSVAAAACIVLALSVWNYDPSVPGNTTGFALKETPQPGPVENHTLVAAPEKAPEKQSTRSAVAYVAAVATKNTTEAGDNTSKTVKHNPSSQPEISVPVLTATEGDNFSSYSKTRRPDEYSEALAGNYTLPVPDGEGNGSSLQPAMKKTERPAGNPLKSKISHLTSLALERFISDPSFARKIDDDALSPKVKVAAALAFATGKASNGKVQVEPIPDDDGSLSALSFRSGRYNYTKKF